MHKIIIIQNFKQNLAFNKLQTKILYIVLKYCIISLNIPPGDNTRED